MLMVIGMINLQFKGGSKICNTSKLFKKSTKQRAKIANLVETKDEMWLEKGDKGNYFKMGG